MALTEAPTRDPVDRAPAAPTTTPPPTPAPPLPTTIESVRVMLGLSRPQLLDLLDVRLGRRSIFRARSDAEIDPVFCERANALLATYQDWKASVLAAVARAGSVSVVELARILGCDRFTLYQSKRRGTFRATHLTGKRNAIVTLESVQQLFSLNEHVKLNNVHLTDYAGHDRVAVRGPLTDIFLRACQLAPPRRTRHAHARQQLLSA